MLVARLEPSLPSVESVDCDNGEDVDSTHLRDSLPSALVDSPWAEAALGSTVVDGGLGRHGPTLVSHQLCEFQDLGVHTPPPDACGHIPRDE